MKPNYKNWMPKGMIWSFAVATAVAMALTLIIDVGWLKIAVAKRNPQATVTGIDRWGAEYDIFSKDKYGDMQAFVKKLNEHGYERAELVPTDNGRFMSPWEAK
ncbi:MAG: hypothetical protein IKI66_00385 [Bacteroidales bacterium]|nr:hypothetical protein [Bacteroidales bacterium]